MSKETSWGEQALKMGEFTLHLGWAALQLPQASITLQPQFLNQLEGHVLIAQVPPIPWKPIQIPDCNVVFTVESFYFVKGPIPENQRIKRLPDRSGSTVEYNPGDRYAGPVVNKAVDLIIADSFPIPTLSDQFGRGIWQDATGTQHNEIELTGPNNVQAPGGAPSFSVDVVDPDEDEKTRVHLECNTGRLQRIRRWTFKGNNAQVIPTPQVDGTPRPAVSPAVSPIPKGTETVANLPPQYPFQPRRGVINVREIAESIRVTQAEQAKKEATPTPNQTVAAAETRAAKAESAVTVVAIQATAFTQGVERSRQVGTPATGTTNQGPNFGEILGYGLTAICGIGVVIGGIVGFIFLRRTGRLMTVANEALRVSRDLLTAVRDLLRRRGGGGPPAPPAPPPGPALPPP